MKTYIYKSTDLAKKRNNNNIIIEVFRVKNNVPEFLGHKECNTASWYGPKATAVQIISKLDGLKLKDNYQLLAKNVQVICI